MAAIDTAHKPTDTTIHRVRDESAHLAGQKLSSESAASSEQFKAASSRPDTAKLHEVKIDTAESKTPESAPKPEIKAQPDNNKPVVEKDKAGNVVYTKNPDGKGGFTDMRTAPDGTMTAAEQSPNGDYTKHIMSGTSPDITTITHKQDGKGGFTDTTAKSDGTSTVHTQKENGDFAETHYRGKQIESEKIRTMDGKGGYSETTKANGSDVTKTYDSAGREVPNQPPVAEVPPAADKDPSKAGRERIQPPADAMGEAANQTDSVGGHIYNAARVPKAATNTTEVLKEGARDIKAAAEALKNGAGVAKALGTAGQVAESIAKGLGNISPAITGLQIAGIGVQAYEGDTTGAFSNAGRMIFTKGAAIGAAALATESSPLGMAAAGVAANQAAGRLWDGVADGSINRQSTMDFFKSAGERFIHMGDSPNFSD